MVLSLKGRHVQACAHTHALKTGLKQDGGAIEQDSMCSHHVQACADPHAMRDCCRFMTF